MAKNKKSSQKIANPEQVAQYIAEAIEAYDEESDDILQIDDGGYGKIDIWFRNGRDYDVYTVEVGMIRKEW